MNVGVYTNAEGSSRAKPKSEGLRSYEELVAAELRMQIAAKRLRLKVISNELERRGIRESEKGLSAKLKAGTFSAAYYLAIKETIESL